MEHLHPEVKISTVVEIKERKDLYHDIVHYHISMHIHENSKMYCTTWTVPRFARPKNLSELSPAVVNACRMMEEKALEDENFGSNCVLFTHTYHYNIGE